MTHKSIEVIHVNLIYKLTFPSKYSAPPAAISFSNTSTHSLVDLSCDKSFHPAIPPLTKSAHLSQSGLKL